MDKSGTGQAQSQVTLITSLMRADAYPHEVLQLQMLDTHISWVILTGNFAYKIKKALKLAFLDFSTLELRRHFCEEELRLNSRWAPELYLEVVPIFGTHENPTLAGSGEAIEYAVKMLQFEQSLQLDKQLELGLLSEKDMRDLAETIDGYHEQADIIACDSEVDAFRDASVPMYDNFPPVTPVVDSAQLEKVRDWTEQSLNELRGDLVQRRKAGFVRECHGDLHLTNLVRLPNGIVPYDCVEFAPELRIMDILSDLSFLVMDLVARDRGDLAYTLLNRYLEKSGDYHGMCVFGLYFVYHCMIRAKVAAIRNTERSRQELAGRLTVALQWIDRQRPVLVAMHGYSGTGKTWLSSQLLSHLPAVRVRSDIERKRLYGVGEFESTGSGVGKGIYTQAASDAVYGKMMRDASDLLDAGVSVILDASFLQRPFRRRAEKLAIDNGIDFAILQTTTAEDELDRRLCERAASDAVASEADRQVLQHQLEHSEPLEESERQRCVTVATDDEFDVDDILGQLRML